MVPAASAEPPGSSTAVTEGSDRAASGKRKVVVKVKIVTPAGMPATVTLTRKKKSAVAAKPARRKSVTRKVRVPAGRYRVQAPDVTYRGRLYQGRVTRKSVVAKQGRTGATKVVYRRSPAAHSLALTKLSTRSVALAWKGKKSTRVVLRRTAGSTPAATRKAGVPVRTKGRRATNGGLTGGSAYTYALFSKVRGRWVGPVSLSVGTMTEADKSEAAYVLSEGASLVKRNQVKNARVTGARVALRLAGRTPLLGRALVLPVTPALPGGYLGVVSSVSPGGTVVLKPGAIGDAFDFYSLPKQTIDTGDLELTPKPGTTVGKSRPGSSSRSARVAVPSCLTGTLAGKVTFEPTIDIDGTFEGDVVKKQIRFFPDLPQGARLSGSLQATLGGALSAAVSGGVKCGVDFQPLVVPVAATPVPIQLRLEPQVEVSATGEARVSNIGARATAGVWFKTQFGIGIDNYADGGPIKEAYPLTPATTGTVALNLKVGGEMILGPGAGTSASGAIAGVRGTLDVLNADASFIESTNENDPDPEYCAKLAAGYGLNFDVVGKAWIPGWEVERSIDIPGLNTSGEYGGPWYYPTDCENPGANDVFVLLVEEEANSSASVGAILDSQGYQVTYGTAMPETPADYGQIWVFGVYSGYPPELVEALAAYTRTGGSVMINSEHSCCPQINAGVDALLDSVVTADVDVVTDCVAVCQEGPDALNPAARGAIASTPNAGTVVTTSALGYYTGVPAPNQMLVVGDQVGGTVWEPADMVTGRGRIVTLADSNWSNDYLAPDNADFIENVAEFLAAR